MVSARTGEGIDELLAAMGDRLRVGDRVVELVIPGPGVTCWPRCTAKGRSWARGRRAGPPVSRWSWTTSGRSRFAEFLAS